MLIIRCPCLSGKPYYECCKAYHQRKQLPENALLLMRSRYSAYALCLIDYIIATTHPENPSYLPNKSEWKKQIQFFCQQTEFEGLDILEFQEYHDEAFVTFLARLKQGKNNASFKEKSRFKKLSDRWLYCGVYELSK